MNVGVRAFSHGCSMILKARYVVPVDGGVIENGAIVVEGDRIAAVCAAGRYHGQAVTDYGEAVITPGFVNAHTHLELTSLAGRVAPSPDFVDWLRRLMAVRAAEPSTRERVQESVRRGTAQSFSAGVTCIGDITTSPAWTRRVLGESGLSGVSFGEVSAIGRRRYLLAERLDAAARAMPNTKRLQAGISPHAPYSVSPESLRACAERARSTGAPLCIHLSETREEEQFTRSADGPLAEFLRGLDVWDESIVASGCSPIELAERTGVLSPRTVIAHANYVSDADIQLIARRRASVAFCPRTHAAFGHEPHRFRDTLSAGINVCIGTDSLASNPSLSVLEELRFLRGHDPGLDPSELIAMGTLRGAQALGLAEETGSLMPRKYADLLVIPLAAGDVGWETILDSTVEPLAVYVSGNLVERANSGSDAV